MSRQFPIIQSIVLFIFAVMGPIAGYSQAQGSPAIARANRRPDAVTTRAVYPARSDTASGTNSYHIGISDILDINILGTSNGRGFYAVRPDATIDYGLAGERVLAAGLTPEDLARQLSSRITLYRGARIEVKVRQYRSHAVVLSGLVSNGGIKYISRESVPLYVICADADVNPKAIRVTVRDPNTGAVHVYDLSDPNTSNVLIQTGDELEFSGT